MRNIIAAVAVLSLASGLSCAALTAQPQGEEGKAGDLVSEQLACEKKAIAWSAPRVEAGKTIFPGSLAAGFGQFDFFWRVSSDGKRELLTSEPAGSAELSLREKPLFVLPLDRGISLIFQEWIPLFGSRDPVTLRPIAAVSLTELFSPLPDSAPSAFGGLTQEAAPVFWEKNFFRGEAAFRPGWLKGASGRLNIYWKTVSRQPPELVTLDAPGAGELPAVETKLFVWNDEKTGASFICRLRQPLVNSKTAPYLVCLAAAKTAELLAGLKGGD